MSVALKTVEMECASPKRTDPLIVIATMDIKELCAMVCINAKWKYIFGSDLLSVSLFLLMEEDHFIFFCYCPLRCSKCFILLPEDQPILRLFFFRN